MRSASPISCLASQRIWRFCSGSLSCAEVIASAAVAAAAFVSEAPGDLPPSHGGGQSAGTDSTDSKETAEPPEGRRTWLGLGSGLGLGLGVGVGEWVGLGLALTLTLTLTLTLILTLTLTLTLTRRERLVAQAELAVVRVRVRG